MKKPSLDEQVSEQAVLWVSQLDAGKLSPDNNKRFLRWLTHSPQHVNEFISACVQCDATDLVEQYQDIVAEVSWSSPSLRKKLQTRAIARSDTLASSAVSVPMRFTGETVNTDAKHHKWSFGVVALAGLFLCLSLFLGMWAYMVSNNGFSTTEDDVNRSEVHTTQVGEQRSVLLQDGSLVNMNTQTQIEANYSEAYRDVAMLSGEALFNVAKHPDWPLRIWSRHVVVTGNNAEFTLRQQAQQTRITAIRGTVRIDIISSGTDSFDIAPSGNALADMTPSELDRREYPAQVRDAVNFDAQNPMYLAAGDEWVVDNRGGVEHFAEIDLSRRLAWTQRKLIFAGETLQEVVREFNRYHQMQLSIADARIAKLPISGVFSTHHPQTLIDSLQFNEDIEVMPTGRQRMELRLAEP